MPRHDRLAALPGQHDSQQGKELPVPLPAAPRITAAIRALIVTFLLGIESTVLPAIAVEETDAPTERVGRSETGRIVTPVNQVLTPFGRQVELPGLRPQAMALSPDRKLLVVSGKTNELVVIHPETGEIRQRVPLPATTRDRTEQLSFTGLVFSSDGRRIYFSNVNGSIEVFEVADDGAVRHAQTIPLPPADAPRRKEEIPAGLAVSLDRSRLYVCANLSNRVHEIRTSDATLLRSWNVGVAPYDVVLVQNKLFVSNWGGRRPEAGDLVGPAGRGTTVRVDPVRHIASEGSVSVIPLDQDTPAAEVLTGLHASGLAVSPDGRYVVCCSAASDTLSVFEAATNQVVDTVWVKHRPSDLFGASPNAACFAADGQRLYVANGSQNAIAVLHWEPAKKGGSRLLGYIPVGWYPGAVVCDAPRNHLYVANIKGLPESPERYKATGGSGFNSRQHQGSVSLVPLPAEAELAALSELVQRNLRRGALEQAALPPRANQPARAVPERIGEPSLIRHVVYIIKENRTYDQVFGALGRGRGRADLCIFGEQITPNQHKLVREFVLLDNTYCAGILSADGHQWSTTAFTTDYLERSFAGFPRSYPDGMGVDDDDALAYSPAGFLWDNAVLHHKSIRNYGEFMMPRVRWRDDRREDAPDFLACYRTWKDGSGDVVFESAPSIESIRAFSPPEYVGWEMSVPDQFRADFILRELRAFESKRDYPQLVIICLPNDHTSGTSPGCPTPDACVADNDLAFGRIVEALSHSIFWPRMAIFAIEDDPQAGWDHVSGYRTTAYCISPYAKRGAVVSTQYNTTSIVRTIEQILGLPPKNQFDASATPMFDCFTDTPDVGPFVAVPANIPLDQMNPDPKAIRDEVLRRDAIVSATLNFREVDRAPEDVLNRILWRAMRGTEDPYPDWAAGTDDEDDDLREDLGQGMPSSRRRGGQQPR